MLSLLVAPPATGTTYDRSPRPTVLLAGSSRFVAQDSWDGVALYRLSDRSLVHRFRVPAGVCTFAVTPDEKVLLLAGADGSLAAWDLATAATRWSLSPSRSGLSYVDDVCFAGDGRSVIVCNSQDEAFILETATGRRIGVVSFPPGQNNIMSAALSPDGSRGVLVDLLGHVFEFDVATGQMRPTGFTGAGPVRYSVDGRYVALRSDNSGIREQLRVAKAGNGWAVCDLGKFSSIGHIRSVGDGFVATAQMRESSSCVGVWCLPDNQRLQEIWRLSTPDRERTDFSTEAMIGVCTDCRLVTNVIDFRSGAVSGSIDNSANYRPVVMTSSSRDIVPPTLERLGVNRVSGWLVPVGGLCVVAVVLAFGVMQRRRRSRD